MKGVAYYQYGGVEELETLELPVPACKSGEVLVRVKAISLNPRDTRIREGAFRLLMNWRFPKLTGADFSGVIETTGAGVQSFRAGDEVFGYMDTLAGGTSAEYITVPASSVARKPAGMSHSQASTLGCAYLTALQVLRDKASTQPGDHVMIYGASGGVGTAAIQLAKQMGAEVTAVSNSAHQEYCRSLGAHHFLAYDQDPVFTGPKTCDVFFQVYSRGGLFYRQAKKILKKDGVFICLIPNPLLEIKRWFARPRFEYLVVKNRVADLSYLAECTLLHDIKPVITHTFEAAEIRKAYRLLETGHIQGKIVVLF